MLTRKEIREIITLLREPEIKLLVEQDSVNFEYIAKSIENLLIAADKWQDECKTLRKIVGINITHSEVEL